MKYDPTKVLTRQNFTIDLVDYRIYMYIGFSKTMQFSQKDLVLPIPGKNDPILDPACHLHELFTRVRCPPTAPAFSYKVGGVVHQLLKVYKSPQEASYKCCVQR